jgi:hypothetical protein
MVEKRTKWRGNLWRGAWRRDAGERGFAEGMAAMASTEDTSPESSSYAWLDLVSEFSKLHLIQETDRMPALSGW